MLDPRNHACSRRKTSGFTLVEVLVSIVILSIGIVVVLQAFQTSLTALSESRNVLRSSTFARRKLAEIDSMVARDGIEQVRQSVPSTFIPLEGFFGVIQFSEPEPDALPPDMGSVTGLVQVTVSVAREDGNGQCAAAAYMRTQK